MATLITSFKNVFRFLNLPISNSDQFHIMIGDGEQLVCNTQCLTVPVLLSNTSFTIDFFILLLGGADLVLGVQWLKTFCPIITDYSTLQLEFTWHNEKFSFKDYPILFYMKFLKTLATFNN